MKIIFVFNIYLDSYYITVGVLGGLKMMYIYVNVFEDRVLFSVIEFEEKEEYKIKEEEIILPASFSMGNKLAYIKKIISVIIDQYNIKAYNMEVDDDIDIDIIEVVKMEGVLEELFSCKGVMLWK